MSKNRPCPRFSPLPCPLPWLRPERAVAVPVDRTEWTPGRCRSCVVVSYHYTARRGLVCLVIGRLIFINLGKNKSCTQNVMLSIGLEGIVWAFPKILRRSTVLCSSKPALHARLTNCANNCHAHCAKLGTVPQKGSRMSNFQRGFD